MASVSFLLAGPELWSYCNAHLSRCCLAGQNNHSSSPLGEEIIYLVSFQYSLAGSPEFLDFSWCSAGLLGVNWALLSQPGYVNRLWSSSLGNMVCQRGGGGEVVISGYYTNTVWLGPLDSWTLAGVPWLLGVNLALLSHSSWVSVWTAEELLKLCFVFCLLSCVYAV